jgi:hypothetical protein
MSANRADIQFCLFDAGHYMPREGLRYPLHKRLDDGEGHSDVLSNDAQISKNQDANSKFLDAREVK